jgi:polysaccharide pyruvyl transferase WcaK-like protein
VDGKSHTNTVVGLLGAFDIASYGDLLMPRIAARELAARLPHVEFRVLAPFGWEHPVEMDGGMVAEPLGVPTAQRRAELANQLDALVIGGGELGHGRDRVFGKHYAATTEQVIDRLPTSWFVEGVGVEHESCCPTLWNGVGVPFALTGDTAVAIRRSLADRSYVSVRDERSLERLREAGVTGEIVVVPNAAFLVPRLFPAQLLRRRRALHHLAGWLPTGDYIVVQGNSAMVPRVGQVCAAIDAVLADSPLTIVAMDAGPAADHQLFSEALRGRCATAVHLLPTTLLTEDIAAVLQGARAVVSVSLHSNVTAMSFRVPTVIVDVQNHSKLSALAELTGPTSMLVSDLSQLPAALNKALCSSSDGQLVASLQAELDVHFDRMAAVIERAVDDESIGSARAQRRAAVVAQELRALRRAHAVRSRQLVAERSALGAAYETQLSANALLREQLDIASKELADERHQRHAAVARIGELDVRVAADGAELALLRVSVVTTHATLIDEQSHAADLEQQLHLTEAALDAVHRTKTFRLTRVPRRIFGWFRR